MRRFQTRVRSPDAKLDAIAFCVKTHPSGSFMKNRTNMHEMQNRIKIAFCVKPSLPSISLADKKAHVKFSGGGGGGGGGSVGLAPALPWSRHGETRKSSKNSECASETSKITPNIETLK